MVDETSNMNGGHATEEPYQDDIRPPISKRILLSVITFIPALLLLSIINYALTRLLVTKPPPPPQPVKTRVEPEVVTKTVYIEPSESDLARIRSEIEASDPLPPITSTEGRSSEIESVVSSLQLAMDARNAKRGSRYQEHYELTSTHASFLQRFDEDVSKSVTNLQDGRLRSAKLLEKLSSFKSLLSLTEFSTVERKNLTDMFQSVGTAVEWLLQSGDERLFLNDEDMLLKALVADLVINNPNECSTFLNLNRDTCAELSIPAGAKIMSKAKSVGEIHVPEGTARESDLYRSVESIKEILSRRDASLIKPDGDGSIPSPLGEDGTVDILKEIDHAAVDAQNLMQERASQMQEMRLRWVSKVESSMPGSTEKHANDNMCANEDLIEQMVQAGLESLRKKSDLSRDLRTTLFSAIVNTPNFEAHDMKALQQAMQDVSGVTIDYEAKKHPLPSGTKSNRKSRSVCYLVDGPLLHRGVTGWINSIVDFISGYDDNIDAFLDWIVGDSRSTVGEIIVERFLKVIRLLPPFNEDIAERFKSAGILAGRTRTLLED